MDEIMQTRMSEMLMRVAAKHTYAEILSGYFDIKKPDEFTIAVRLRNEKAQNVVRVVDPIGHTVEELEEIIDGMCEDLLPDEPAKDEIVDLEALKEILPEEAFLDEEEIAEVLGDDLEPEPRDGEGAWEPDTTKEPQELETVEADGSDEA